MSQANQSNLYSVYTFYIPIMRLCDVIYNFHSIEKFLKSFEPEFDDTGKRRALTLQKKNFTVIIF